MSIDFAGANARNRKRGHFNDSNGRKRMAFHDGRKPPIAPIMTLKITPVNRMPKSKV
jgi:hypothetical protein